MCRRPWTISVERADPGGRRRDAGDLSAYDAIILGTRAYAVRPELKSANNRLLEYVKNGGVWIVQYNLQDFDQNYGPYPFSLDRFGEGSG